MGIRTPYRGFTLIELMLVVAIIGLLAAIALPKFSNLVVRAKEAGVKGKLGALRSAFRLYYADNEGMNVGWQDSDVVKQSVAPRYIQEVPSIDVPTVPAHGRGADFHTGIQLGAYFDFPAASPYNYFDGRLVVDCTHRDSRGTTWTQF